MSHSKNSSAPAGSYVLVLARPGDERDVLDWIAAHRPWVLILTEGSAPLETATLDATRLTLAQRGAREASLFGRFAEAEIHRRLEDHDAPFFVEIAREIAELLVVTEATSVVGGALSDLDVIPTVCRLLIDAAVVRLARQAKHVPQSYSLAASDLVLLEPGASLATRPEPPNEPLSALAEALIAWSGAAAGAAASAPR